MITVEQTLSELRQLIERYPDNTGTVLPSEDAEYDDKECVYYTDEHGDSVRMFKHNEDLATSTVVLKTPVCIVGHWVEEFHPELKEDAIIRNILIRNSRIHAAITKNSPLPCDVIALLGDYQAAQDHASTPTWSGIESYLLREGKL